MKKQEKANQPPDKTVRNYVKSFFEPIRYSGEVSEAKEKITEALEPVYAQMKRENETEAIAGFVARYPNLEALLEAAGLDREKTAQWRSKASTVPLQDFLIRFKERRKQLWITVSLFAFAAVYLAAVALSFGDLWLVKLAVGLALAAAGVLLTLRFRKKRSAEKYVLSVDDYGRAEKLFERYGQKSVNWLMILFLEVFVVAFRVISLGVNSKAAEIAEQVSGSLGIVAFAAFFFVKDRLLQRWLMKAVDYEHEPKYKKEFRRQLILSAVYWLAGLGLYYVFEYFLAKDISVVFFALYCLLILAFDLFRLKNFTYGKPKFVKPAIAILLVAAIALGGYSFMSRNVWLTQPYINATPNLNDSRNEITYDPETGVFTITNDDDSDFKILQLTDIHLGGSVLSYDKDLKALQACYALIEAARPDLVVVTGDLCFPMGAMSFSFNNTAPVQQFAAFMRNTGIPWAFTYGNHDTESMSATRQSGLDALYRSLSWDTSKNLLYPYVQPEVWGRNNQLIEIRNADGSLNQALFLIDSNAYTGEGLNKYDYIHDDQVEWYRENVLRLNEEEGRTISSMAFFHIPLQQYRTAYELYEAGSDEVTWFFGSNDEQMIDKVCCSEYPSSFFDVAKELGSTKATFCGHDHYNTMSLEYEGIRLTYGMSIDYLAMPGIEKDTAQRGGELITIHRDGSWDLQQIPLVSIE